jgi:membrane peptidoglycan carboxypeptidase
MPRRRRDAERRPDEATSGTERRNGVGFWRVLSHLTVMVAVAAVVGLLAAGLAIPFAAVGGLGARTVADSMDDLPSELEAQPLPQRTRVLAADGSLMAMWYDQNRVNVPLNRVALIMRKAIVAIEDYRFYEHGALDIKGTLRAFITNQANSGVVQGGSSITQQMVKQTLINQAKTQEEVAAAQADTYERKFNELRYAIAFEEHFSKDWILERYLNISYFGDGAYGIEAASRHYFSKPAGKLTLAEAATLAGLVQNPTKYDPTNNPAQARERRDVVLNRMAELNVISKTEAARAKSKPVRLRLTQNPNGCVSSVAPFFCDYVREYLLHDERLGRTVENRRRLLNAGGLTIQTTMKPRMQNAADRSVRDHVDPTDQAIGGLAMVVPGTGEVRALSQSRPMGNKKRKGQTYLNYVVPRKYGDSGGFQAGSTFKVFVLAAAIDQGVPLNTKINAPETISIPASQYRTCDGNLASTDTWTPSNSTGAGTYDLYSGTQDSVNTFFAQLELRTGLCQPIRLAREMGVVVPERDVVGPFTLGVTSTDPLTMASVYATFGARGEYCEPRPVSKITSSSGKLVADYPNKCKRVLSEDVADAVNEILRGVQEHGFGAQNGLGLDKPSAAKTGTIQDNMAVWYDGYTPHLAAAAMLAGANSSGQPITLNGQVVGGSYIGRAFGSTYAGPIWGDAMKAVQDMVPATDFAEPDPTTIAGRKVIVPSVSGMAPSSAAARLRRAGFLPTIGPLVDSGYSYGTVAYTSPGGGSTVGTGSSVTIYVSDGTPYVPPPKAKPKPKPKPKPNRNRGGGGGGGGGNGGGRGNG